MSMSRQDYERIATAIRNVRDTATSEFSTSELLDTVTESIADQLHADRPDRFDADRFMKACGFGQ
jgi:hypothetical protein